MRILVIEGEQTIRDLYSTYYERKVFGDAKVIICGSLNEAEQVLEKDSGFQLLITCWDLVNRNDGTGEKVAQLAIKGGMPSDKIILITRGRDIMEAKQVKETFEKGIQAEIGDCLIKPVHLKKFRELLKKYCHIG